MKRKIKGCSFGRKRLRYAQSVGIKNFLKRLDGCGSIDPFLAKTVLYRGLADDLCAGRLDAFDQILEPLVLL